jgi:outer membrane lipoprotein LolB
MGFKQNPIWAGMFIRFLTTSLMTWLTSVFKPMRGNRWRAAGALMLPLLLVGCASIAPPSGTATQQTMQPRAFRDAIDISGRLSVQYQQNGKDESLHGNFVWSQTPQRTVVTLLSPLGQTMATINVTPTSSTLLQAGQPPRIAQDVDALVAGTLGWPLPISGLRNWLQGFVVTANGQRFIAQPQAPEASAVTTPDGWRIHYASWQNDDLSSIQNRPKRIDLDRSTAQAGDVSIRIVIDSWQGR